MPSRAWVVTYEGAKAWLILMFQCPLGLELLRHDANRKVCTIHVSMPSRAWVVTFKLRSSPQHGLCFNALMGLSCYAYNTGKSANFHRFNALMGLYLISTLRNCQLTFSHSVCQCPHGLIPHFYEKKLWEVNLLWNRVNALSGLYLISTVPLQKPRFYAVFRACFCRYLSEYSDNSSFSCMLTFWTYLMRYTYPWHWIKYSTNYNRCHPIFSLSW